MDLDGLIEYWEREFNEVKSLELYYKQISCNASKRYKERNPDKFTYEPLEDDERLERRRERNRKYYWRNREAITERRLRRKAKLRTMVDERDFEGPDMDS